MNQIKKTRYLPNYRNGRGIGFFQSVKNGSRVWCDSHLELMSYRYLDFKADIVSYKAQPVQYIYEGLNGKDTGYTVDTEVIDNEKSIKKLEIKPKVFVDDPAEQQRFRHFRELLLESKNQLVEYLTDEEVCKGFTQQNLTRLCHLRKLSLNKEQALTLANAVGKLTTWGAMQETAKKLNITPRMTKLMLAHQKYRFDYAELLTSETKLEIGA
ncbi:hypothetical protein [Pseudocolwellia agarivorans]|uniref:hypothetical protein n=1 Tax=Pseudocolwellia agarivorans TaxID=1911682 RepID=UPI000985AC81|nr:hypothetical protein [Pseudocolwellia agarivorans]